jgi:hypothetical protein
MDDYISKPIITDDLESMIMKWSPKNDSGMRNKTTVRTADDKNDQQTLLDPAAIQRLMDIGKQTDPGFLQQVLDMFMRQAPECIDEIRAALEAGDFNAMWKAAHKLKGTSLNIGAQRFVAK